MIHCVPGYTPDLMRVLLAEDERKIAQHVRAALREQGFTVDMFHRGDEALEAALATPYDALILDVMMPGRDGLSILRVLREKRVTSPVLLMTARGEGFRASGRPDAWRGRLSRKAFCHAGAGGTRRSP
jgi:CheY-like chemotaxis protein